MGAVKNHFHDDLEARRCAEEGEVDLGPPVYVFRDDPLFNQGYVAAELALATLRQLEMDLDNDRWTDAGVGQSISALEAFLTAALEDAKDRAEQAER